MRYTGIGYIAKMRNDDVAMGSGSNFTISWEGKFDSRRKTSLRVRGALDVEGKSVNCSKFGTQLYADSHYEKDGIRVNGILPSTLSSEISGTYNYFVTPTYDLHCTSRYGRRLWTYYRYELSRLVADDNDGLSYFWTCRTGDELRLYRGRVNVSPTEISRIIVSEFPDFRTDRELPSYLFEFYRRVASILPILTERYMRIFAKYSVGITVTDLGEISGLDDDKLNQYRDNLFGNYVTNFVDVSCGSPEAGLPIPWKRPEFRMVTSRLTDIDAVYGELTLNVTGNISGRRTFSLFYNATGNSVSAPITNALLASFNNIPVDEGWHDITLVHDGAGYRLSVDGVVYNSTIQNNIQFLMAEIELGFQEESYDIRRLQASFSEAYNDDELEQKHIYDKTSYVAGYKKQSGDVDTLSAAIFDGEAELPENITTDIRTLLFRVNPSENRTTPILRIGTYRVGVKDGLPASDNWYTIKIEIGAADVKPVLKVFDKDGTLIHTENIDTVVRNPFTANNTFALISEYNIVWDFVRIYAREISDADASRLSISRALSLNKFSGIVRKLDNATKERKVVVQGDGAVLADTIVPVRVFSDATPSSIVSSLISDFTDFTFEEYYGVGRTDQILETYLADGKLSDIISELAKLNNYTWAVLPTGRFLFEPQRVHKSSRVYRHGGNATLFETKTNDSDLVNDVIVYGDDGQREATFHIAGIPVGESQYTLPHRPRSVEFDLGRDDPNDVFTLDGLRAVYIPNTGVVEVERLVDVPHTNANTFGISLDNFIVKYTYNVSSAFKKSDQESIDKYGIHAKRNSTPQIGSISDTVKFATDLVESGKAPHKGIPISFHGLDNLIEENAVVRVIHKEKEIDDEFLIKAIQYQYPKGITKVEVGEYEFSEQDAKKQVLEKIHSLEKYQLHSQEVATVRDASEVGIGMGVSVSVFRTADENIDLSMGIGFQAVPNITDTTKISHLSMGMNFEARPSVVDSGVRGHELSIAMHIEARPTITDIEEYNANLSMGMSIEARPSILGPPDPPKNLKVIWRDVRVSSAIYLVRVEWEPPDNDGGSPISGYRITSQVTLSQQRQYNFGPNARHFNSVWVQLNEIADIRVYARSARGESEPAIFMEILPPPPVITSNLSLGMNFQAVPYVVESEVSNNQLSLGMVFEASPVVIDLPETTFNLSMGMSFQASPIITDISVPDQVDISTLRVVVSEWNSALNKIDLSWEAPYDGGSVIIQYVIHFKRSLESARDLFGLETNPMYTAYESKRTLETYYRIRAKNALGFGEYSDWRRVSYEISPTATPPSQVTGLSASATNENSINVSWNKPNDGGSAITKYIVEYTDSGGTVNTVEPTGTSVTISVSAGETYTIRVRAVNAEGNGAWSNTVEVMTGEAPETNTAPEKIGTIRHTLTGNSLALSWDPPKTGGRPITEYNVGYRVGVAISRTIVDTSTTSLTLTVTPGTTYTIDVRAVNDIDDGPWSDAILIIVPDTPEPEATAPAKVTGVISRRNRGSATISWSAPDDGGSAILRYDIEYTISGTSNIETSSSRTYTLSGIAGTYSVRVRAVNSAGDGQWSDSISSEVGPNVAPSAPQNFKAVVTGFRIDLSWEAPLDDGGINVDDYTVTLSSGNTRGGITGTTWVDTVTRAGTYTLSVQARNGDNLLSPKASVTVTISAPPPTATVPGKVGVTLSRSGTSVTVIWQTPDDGGSDIQRYEVEWGYNSGVYLSQQFVTSSPYTITNRDRGRTVYVVVRAVNAIGDGPLSDEASISIPIVSPSVPRSFADNGSSGDTIRVKWLAPSDNGGSAITGYTIEAVSTVNGVKTTDTYTTTSLSWSREFALAATGTVAVRVRAYNAQLSGPYTGARTFTITVLRAPDAPTNLAVTPSYNNGVVLDVSWGVPTSDGGASVSGYSVQLLSGVSIVRAVSVRPSVRSQRFTGLSRGTAYSVAVAASNSQGGGAFARQSITTPDVPEAVDTINARFLLGRGYVIGWGASTTRGTPVTRYRVDWVYRGFSGTQYSTVNSLIVAQPQAPGISFTITPESAYGDGPSKTLTVN